MEQHSVLSEKCIKCGNVFDLGYDLDSVRNESFNEIILAMKKLERNSLMCWKCRANKALKKRQL